MEVFCSITLILFAKAVSGELLNCGSAVIDESNTIATLKCNTSSPITELYWGVKSAEEPDPVLIIIDPSGQRPGVNIGSTNYGGRVFFVGNMATGDASMEIRNLMANDTKDYLWKIDDGGGIYKRYVMPLVVKPLTTTSSPTTRPITANATTSINCSGSRTTPTTPSPKGTQTTVPNGRPGDEPQGLSTAEIAGIVIGVISGVIIIAVIILIVYKKFSNKSQEDNRPTEKMQGKVADQETEMKTSSAAKA